MDDEALAHVNQQRKARGQRRLHRCDACGHVDVWGDSWSWYGSEADIEDGVPIAKVCGRTDCVPDANPKAIAAAYRKAARLATPR